MVVGPSTAQCRRARPSARHGCPAGSSWARHPSTRGCSCGCGSAARLACAGGSVRAAPDVSAAASARGAARLPSSWRPRGLGDHGQLDGTPCCQAPQKYLPATMRPAVNRAGSHGPRGRTQLRTPHLVPCHVHRGRRRCRRGQAGSTAFRRGRPSHLMRPCRPSVKRLSWFNLKTPRLLVRHGRIARVLWRPLLPGRAGPTSDSEARGSTEAGRLRVGRAAGGGRTTNHQPTLRGT